MKKGSYKNYHSAWPIINRHWQTTLPYLNFKKFVNLFCLGAEKIIGCSRLNGRPFFIKIEPTNKCNLRCSGCLHAADRTELVASGYLGDMDFNVFKKIINELKDYLIKVSLYSMGEPLLYPKIADMVAYLNIKNIGSVISSNMNYLTEKLAHNLVKNKLTHLIVSLDGHNEKTYNRYRKGGSFERVIKNIKLIQKEKERQKSKYPIIEIQIINLDCISKEEIKKVEELAKKLKAEKFTIKENVTPHYDHPQPQVKKCFWLYGNPQIHWSGVLQPCCHYYEYKNNNFGNVTNDSLVNIWNNEKYQAARKYFSVAKKRKNMDIKCYNCIFFKPDENNKVRFIERINQAFSRYNRTKKWNIFMDYFKPDFRTKVLDVGFCENEYKESDNYIEKKYPYPENLTALGIEKPVKFKERYPWVKALLYQGNNFPFTDKEFDICFSSAVIEHVGGLDKQVKFLKELKRVGQRSFLTTPNKYFPVEVHTRILLLHFLPKVIFNKILHFFNKKWAADNYMNLLSLRKIKIILKLAGIDKYKVINNKFLFLTVDFLIIF